MTRGYVVLTRGTHMVKSAYLESSAYVSGYGHEILAAIYNDTINDWMDKQIDYNHEAYGSDEPNSKLTLDWLRPSKNTKGWKRYDFCEYGYIYNINTEVLKVYNFGKLCYAISKKAAERYLWLFEHENEIWKSLNYDPETCYYRTKEIDVRKVVATMDSLESFKKLLPDNPQYLWLSNDHCIDVWHTAECPQYLAFASLETKDGEDRLGKFIVGKSRFGNYWEIYRQDSDCRRHIGGKYPSEKQARVWLMEYVRSNIDFLKANQRKFSEKLSA